MELICKRLLEMEGGHTAIIRKGIITASSAQALCVRCSLWQFREVRWEA